MHLAAVGYMGVPFSGCLGCEHHIRAGRAGFEELAGGNKYMVEPE